MLLASLVVVIVGGMGSIVGTALGAVLIGLAEQYRLGLHADLRRRADLPHHGGGAGLPAAGHHGGAAMSLARTGRAGADSRIGVLAPLPAAIGSLAIACRACLHAGARQQVRADARSSAWRFAFGIIALSLQFLAGYGGMVSLAQMTVAGVAGYMVAILGVNTMGFGLGWPWWIAIPHRAAASPSSPARLIGLLAIRTDGIYTIMITLAIAAAFSYFTFQNYDDLQRLQRHQRRHAAGACSASIGAEPIGVLLSAAGASPRSAMLAVLYVSRSTFGLALQGIRDNARRMEAIGFNVPAHRVAAYVFAGRHRRGRRRPAVLAQRAHLARHDRRRRRHRHPDHRRDRRPPPPDRPLHRRPDLCVCLSTFAMDMSRSSSPRERFKLVVGLGFLLMVLFSPDGVLGICRAHPRNAGRRNDSA